MAINMRITLIQQWESLKHPFTPVRKNKLISLSLKSGAVTSSSYRHFGVVIELEGMSNS
jgi:hypothetical protein